MKCHGELFDQKGGFKFGLAACTDGDCAENHVENDALMMTLVSDED
jgi:hypothetical protein